MKILYHDRDLAVCVKPVGLDSEKALPEALIAVLGGEIYPIHRCDTSSCQLWCQFRPEYFDYICSRTRCIKIP